MSDNGQGTSQVEIRHVNELVGLVRQDINSLREEVRSGLGHRVTHAEVAGFMSTVEEKLKSVTMRIDTIDREQDEDRKFRRQLFVGLIGTIITAIVSILIAVFS